MNLALRAAFTEGRLSVSHKYILYLCFFLQVGPTGEKPAVLRSAYRSALDCAKERGLKTIALCAVSTGIYGYKVHACLCGFYIALPASRSFPFSPPTSLSPPSPSLSLFLSLSLSLAPPLSLSLSDSLSR